jgi:chaperonin cofactor prefoldin
MTLYEMTQNTNALYELLQNEEIDEQTFNDTMEAMGTAEKVEGYCQIIKQLKADEEALKKEIDRLSAKKKAAENGQDRMKSALTDFMAAAGKTKDKVGTFSISMRETASVNIINELDLPERFLIPQLPKADKKAIKEAIENGEAVDGAELIFKKGVTIR